MSKIFRLASFANHLDRGGHHRVASQIDSMLALAVPEGGITAENPVQEFYNKLEELLDLSKSLPKVYKSDITFLKELRKYMANELGISLPKESRAKRSRSKPIQPPAQQPDDFDLNPEPVPTPTEEVKVEAPLEAPPVPKPWDRSSIKPLPKGPVGTKTITYEPKGTSVAPSMFDRAKSFFS